MQSYVMPYPPAQWCSEAAVALHVTGMRLAPSVSVCSSLAWHVYIIRNFDVPKSESYKTYAAAC